MSIYQWRIDSLLCNLSSLFSICRDPSFASRHDHRESQRVGDSHQCDHHGTNPPCPPDIRGFIALGKEQVEKEGGSKDCGDGDADEYVVGGDADKVVVMHARRGM